MKIIKKLIKYTGIVVVTLLLLGVIVEASLSYFDKKSLTVPGTFKEVNGDNMHIFSIGEGEKTILLVPGLGTTSPYVDFQPIWSRLSKDHKVIVVERFGYGFSDVTKRERTLENIIDEMDQALSGETGPFTLVGHSFGGLISIGYAQAFPEKVENIIMLDSRVPESYEDLPKSANVMSSIGRMLNSTGINRLAQMEAVYELQGMNGFKEVPKEYWETDRKLFLRNTLNRNVRNEQKEIGASADYILNYNNSHYAIPTLFISTPGLFDRDKEDIYVKKLQRGEQVELDGGHHIHQYYPDEVSELIENFIK